MLGPIRESPSESKNHERAIAEFVGVDGVSARREIFLVRRNADQPHLKDFGLTLEEGKTILQLVQAEQAQFQVEQCGMRDRECIRLRAASRYPRLSDTFDSHTVRGLSGSRASISMLQLFEAA